MILLSTGSSPVLDTGAGPQAAPLSALIDATGETLFDVLVGRPDTAPPVTSVSIYDPVDASADYRGAVLLAVGVAGRKAIRAVIDAAVVSGASCVVLREAVELPVELCDRIRDTSLVVLAAVNGVTWNQLSTSLSLGLDQQLARGFEAFRAGRQDRAQTLTDLADALDTALDAPVTIEDLNSNVLSFSNDQMRGDMRRHETILHRAVSTTFKEVLQRNGTFKRLYTSPVPIVIDATDVPGVDVPRIAIRVASAQRVLGSIWVATRTPLDDIDASLLLATADCAAHLMEFADGAGSADADRRQFLVSQLLGGGTDARTAAETLDILHTPAFLITVVPATVGTSDSIPETRLADKLAGSLNLMIVSSHPKGMAAVMNGHVFGVLPVPTFQDCEAAAGVVMGLCERFAHRLGDRTPVHVAVSGLVDSPLELAAAKAGGLRTVGMMARTAEGASKSVVRRADDALLDVMLLELHDKLLSRWPAISTPVSRLIAYDEAHDTDFVPSLVAFFRAFGSVTHAADSLHVHSNTLRYRLKRISEICGVDVCDHDSRMRAMVELRIRRLLD